MDVSKRESHRSDQDEGSVAVTVTAPTANSTLASKKAKVDTKIISHFDVDTGKARSELDLVLEQFIISRSI